MKTANALPAGKKSATDCTLHIVQDGCRRYLADANGVPTGALWDGRMLYTFFEKSVSVTRPWPNPAAWKWDLKKKEWKNSSPRQHLLLHFHPQLTWENECNTTIHNFLGAPRVLHPEKKGTFLTGMFDYRPGAVVPFSKDDDVQSLQKLTLRRENFALADLAFSLIPEKIRLAISRYSNEHWPLLRTAGQYPEFADLLESNPALASVFANRSSLKIGDKRIKKAEYAEILRGKQRSICAYFGFGDQEWVVSILKKMSPYSCNLTTMDLLRCFLQNPIEAETLRHVQKITFPVANLFRTHLFRQSMTASFLNEVAELYPDMDSGHFFLEMEPQAQEEKKETPADAKDLEDMDKNTAFVFDVPDDDIFRKMLFDVFGKEYQAPQAHQAPTLDDFYDMQAMAWHVLCHNHRITLDSLATLRKKNMERQNGQLKRIALEGWAVFPPPPVAASQDIAPLTNANELFEEGEKQHHCCADYEEKVAERRMFFYRLLQPERATISLRRRGNNWLLDQVKLAHNADPQPETIEMVVTWLEDNGFAQPKPKGIDKAKQVFKQANLPFPYIPEKLAHRLREVRNWGYTTRGTDVIDWPENIRHIYVKEADNATLSDYAMLCHAGYGLNSYAMHYFLVYGPLRMFLQLSWGGVYSCEETDVERMKETFALADQIVKEVEVSKRFGKGDHLVIAVSDFYGSFYLTPGQFVDKKVEKYDFLKSLAAQSSGQKAEPRHKVAPWWEWAWSEGYGGHSKDTLEQALCWLHENRRSETTR